MNPETDIVTVHFERAALASLIALWNGAGIRDKSGSFIELAMVEYHPGRFALDATLTSSPAGNSTETRPETRDALAAIAELTDGEIGALIKLNLTMHASLTGTDAKRVAAYHDALGKALAAERVRREAALEAMGDQLDSDGD